VTYIFAADETGHIPVEGGTIWYRHNRAQTEKPRIPILVIHGGPGLSHDYLLPCLELTTDRDVIFYDQLDSGRSSRNNKTELWNLPRFSSEIDAIRKALSLDRIHILASSWGGTIALYYSAIKNKKHQEGLHSLILSGPLINTKRWIEDNEIWRRQLPEYILQALQFHEAHADYDNPSYAKAVSFFYHRHLCRLEPWPDYVRQAMDNANLALYRHMWGPTEFLCNGSLKNLDLTPLLKDIKIPALFISGEFDEGTFSANQSFAKQMPHAQAKMIYGASHMPHVEKTESFFEQVRRFLCEVE